MFIEFLSCSRTSLVSQTVKDLPAMVGNLGSVPGLGRSPGERNGNPLQYSCLKNFKTEESGGLQSMGSESDTTE